MNRSEDSPSDGELIADVLSGRVDRFGGIVRRYERALLRVAHSRLGRADWAEDVVQETMLCAFKSLHSYDSRYSFRTWLWTILLNQCRRHVGRRLRRPRVDTWSDQPAADADRGNVAASLECNRQRPPVVLLAKERAEELEAMLSQLPTTQADALRLRFFAGLKFQEIADAMGCSLSSAKNRVRWGLTKMADKMVRT